MQRNTEHFHSGGSERPMRDLLLQLPLLTASPGEAIQYEEADAFLLIQIAENAEVAMNTIHLGLSAVGQILARAAPEVETGEISGDATEALGWLLAELGDFAATAFCLSAACRRHTADFAPPTPRAIASVRP
jgi:hypothetical protein